MAIPAVILFADAASAHYRVGGLPLLLRHMKVLHKLGVTEFYLFGLTQIPPQLHPDGLPDDIVLHLVACTPEDLLTHLQPLLTASQDILMFQSTWLIDPRLFAALLEAPHPQWLPVPGATTATLPVAARLSATSLHTWSTGGLAQWLGQETALQPAALDPYSPSHRGPVPFYLLAIDTPAAAASATSTLIKASQKRALDLPALLLNPLFENRLVFWLCDTRITPNQVTLFTAVPGIITTLLFLSGWLRLGSLLAYAVAILDGVDGKLARTTLQTSRLGELEHFLDAIIEQSWYLAMTVFLAASTGKPELWWLGGGLMACDLLDKSLYGLGHRLFNKHLDELGRFERGFRLIGGRRNVYLLMFIVGFWTEFPTQALAFVLAWALVTVMVHGSRVVYHTRRHVTTAETVR